MKVENAEESSKDVFKAHYWFIFVKNFEVVKNVIQVFRFDSKFHFVVVNEDSVEIFEAYSIDGESSKSAQIGVWHKNTKFGKVSSSLFI